MNNRGFLIVFSGPSGVGKDTILNKLMGINKNIKLSISATTRPKRDYEEDGKDYYFFDKEQFLNMANNGEMLEFANYCGNYYGTPKRFVDEHLKKGFDVILEIETDGALDIMRKNKNVISIFVLPPSLKELKNRLTSRGTDKENEILKRLEKAKTEIDRAQNYKHIVVNDDIDDCVNQINNIIKKEHLNFCKNIMNEVLVDVKTFNW